MSMLVQFSFSNYKCFKDEATLNLVASNTKGKEHYSFATKYKYSVLKTLAIYGANASGKTKLFEALRFMKSIVIPPKRDEKIPIFDYWLNKYDCFRLNTKSKEENSFFETVFIIDNIQYRYGLEINKNCIVSEWLYVKDKREILAFERKTDSAPVINDRLINAKTAANLVDADMIAATTPFISALATFKDPLSKKVVDWFESIIIISANDVEFFHTITNMNDNKDAIIAFLKSFDIGIEDLTLHEISYDDIPEKIRKIMNEEGNRGKVFDGVNTYHKLFNELYERVDTKQFRLEFDESFGTNRLFALSWPFISSLRKGTLLLIDEIDSGIHPNVVKTLVEMFYKSVSEAQLIINTQNSSLLNSTDNEGFRLFRKDQVYVVNKNRYGESSLMPLSDFKDDLRSNMENLYLEGTLGGVPYLDIDVLLNLVNNIQHE